METRETQRQASIQQEAQDEALLPPGLVTVTVSAARTVSCGPYAQDNTGDGDKGRSLRTFVVLCIVSSCRPLKKKAKWSVDTFKTPSLHIFQFFLFLFIFSSVVSCTSMFMHYCICEELCDVSTLERCYINRVTSFFTKPWWYCIESLPVVVISIILIFYLFKWTDNTMMIVMINHLVCKRSQKSQKKKEILIIIILDLYFN